MKKLRNILFFCLIFMFFPVCFLGCNEVTFDNTPYSQSSKTALDIINDVETSKRYMIEDVGLPVRYKTTTNFSFYPRLDGSFARKNIAEETITTLSNGNDTDAIATVEVNKYVNNNNVLSSISTYSQGDEFLYKSLTQKDDEGLSKTSLSRSRYGTVENSFLNILNKVIFRIDYKTCPLVEEKTFEKIDYYRLSTKAVSFEEGLEYLNSLFVQNNNIYNEPGIFEIYDKTLDYVISFSVEYGIDSSNYLTYFALNYQIEHGDNNFKGERKTYLTVSSVTRLEKYGLDVDTPTLPNNKDFYEVSTFVDTMKKDDSYVIYRDADTQEYNQVTAYKHGDDYIAKYSQYSNGTFGTPNYYYIKAEQDNFAVYSVDTINKTCKKETSFKPLFLFFDFTLENTSMQDDNYIFGAEGEGLIINVKSGEINSVKTNTSAPWFVERYGMTRPSDFDFEFSDLTIVE